MCLLKYLSVSISIKLSSFSRSPARVHRVCTSPYTPTHAQVQHNKNDLLHDKQMLGALGPLMITIIEHMSGRPGPSGGLGASFFSSCARQRAQLDSQYKGPVFEYLDLANTMARSLPPAAFMRLSQRIARLNSTLVSAAERPAISYLFALII